MRAVTSLSPAPSQYARQRVCLESWRAAGLSVLAFNHPSEFAALTELHTLAEPVPVERTAATWFNRHYISINALTDWAVAQAETILIVNSDLELTATPAQIHRFAQLAEYGLPYLLQINTGGDQPDEIEPNGFSAFAFNPKFARLIDRSILCLGQPWWDYWLPYRFTQFELPLYTPTHPIARHQRHPVAWSAGNWIVTGIETAARICPLTPTTRSLAFCRQLDSTGITCNVATRADACPLLAPEMMMAHGGHLAHVVHSRIYERTERVTLE